jgi:hypothetical protein
LSDGEVIASLEYDVRKAYGVLAPSVKPPVAPSNLRAVTITSSYADFSLDTAPESSPIYQWYLDGTPFTTTIIPSVRIQPLTENTAYTVQVSIIANGLSSDSVSLGFTTLSSETVPVWGGIPSPTVILVGAPVSIDLDLSVIDSSVFTRVYAIASGSLPAGLSISGRFITGAVSTPGSATFTVSVTHAEHPLAHSAISNSVVFSILNPDTTAPDAPTNFTAVSYSTTQVKLSWTNPVDAVVANAVTSGFLGVDIYKDGAKIARVLATDPTPTQYLASTTTTALWKIRPVDAAFNKGVYTAELSAGPLIATLDPPINPVVTVNSSTQLTFSFLPPASGAAPTGYRVEMATAAGGPWVNVQESLALSYSVNGLSPSTTRYFRSYTLNGTTASAPTLTISGTTTAASSPGVVNKAIYRDGRTTPPETGVILYSSLATALSSLVPGDILELRSNTPGGVSEWLEPLHLDGINGTPNSYITIRARLGDQIKYYNCNVTGSMLLDDNPKTAGPDALPTNAKVPLYFGASSYLKLYGAFEFGDSSQWKPGPPDLNWDGYVHWMELQVTRGSHHIFLGSNLSDRTVFHGGLAYQVLQMQRSCYKIKFQNCEISKNGTGFDAHAYYLPVVWEGTVVGTGNGYLTLDSTASSNSASYVGAVAILLSGPYVLSFNTVNSYSGGTKRISVATNPLPAWAIPSGNASLIGSRIRIGSPTPAGKPDKPINFGSDARNMLQYESPQTIFEDCLLYKGGHSVQECEIGLTVWRRCILDMDWRDIFGDVSPSGRLAAFLGSSTKYVSADPVFTDPYYRTRFLMEDCLLKNYGQGGDQAGQVSYKLETKDYQIIRFNTWFDSINSPATARHGEGGGRWMGAGMLLENDTDVYSGVRLYNNTTIGMHGMLVVDLVSASLVPASGLPNTGYSAANWRVFNNIHAELHEGRYGTSGAHWYVSQVVYGASPQGVYGSDIWRDWQYKDNLIEYVGDPAFRKIRFESPTLGNLDVDLFATVAGKYERNLSYTVSFVNRGAFDNRTVSGLALSAAQKLAPEVAQAVMCTTTASGSNTITVPVSDPYIFYDGFGMEDMGEIGDTIEIENQRAIVTTVNHALKTLTISSHISFSSGSTVDLIRNGSKIRYKGSQQ